MKIRGGMWCDFCDLPVTGEKSTHRTRAAAIAITAIPSGGASLLASRRDRYVCPNCGQPVRAARREDFERHTAAAPPSVMAVEPSAAPPSTASGTSEVPGPCDRVARLEGLARLRASEALTEEEFKEQKRRLLDEH